MGEIYALIGVDKFAYAVNIKEDKTGVLYKPTVFISALDEIGLDRTVSQKQYSTDEGVVDGAVKYGAGRVAVRLADIPNRDLAAFLCEGYDDTTGLFTLSQSRRAPYCAIMYRCKKANGLYRYVKILKCRSICPTTKNKAVAEKVTADEAVMEFCAVKRKFDGVIEYRIDSDDANFPVSQAKIEAFETAWFADPDYVPKREESENGV